MPATTGDNQPNIGAQVAYWRRKRGKNQRTLAGLAGLSQPYLSQIETGKKPIDSRSLLVSLAQALDVSVADLTGQPGDPTDPSKAAAAAHVPAIREALIAREFGELVEPGPAGPAAVALCAEAGRMYDFAAVARQLPSLLRSLRGPELVETAYVAAFTLRHLGYSDLARDAARLAATAARELGDPAWIGIGEFARILTMPPEMPSVPARLAQQVADELQPQIADPLARQAYGQLHLTGALRAAVDRQPDAAHDHLREAREAARSLGDPQDLGLAGMVFGPTNVGFWSVAVELELGEPQRALEAARAIRPERIPQASRQAPFWADIATALYEVGRDEEAIAAFLRSEAASPQWFRLRPTVRDTVSAIVRRAGRNAVTRPMRRAAVAVGLSDLVKG